MDRNNDVKEITVEVVVEGTGKGTGAILTPAQKYLVEAFKEAGSQDAVGALAGRLGSALPYVMVTAGKAVGQHGYDAIKISIAVKSGDPERVVREILSAAVGTVAAGAFGGAIALAATKIKAAAIVAIPVGIVGAGIMGYTASKKIEKFWDDTLRDTPVGQWSSHQVGNLFKMHIKRLPAPVAPEQVVSANRPDSELPAPDAVLASRLLLDPLDRQLKWVFNSSKTADADVAPSVKSYRVQQGDTLWSIARRNGWELEALLVANPQIQDKNFIRTGQMINRPPDSESPPDNRRSPLIQVTPEPQVQRQIHHEDQGTHDVQQGYARKSATASVRFTQGELDSRVLQDSQRASFVTAGVRPGAVQLDSNPSLAQWLASDDRAGLLFKAIGVSSLAAGARQQVAVDPLVLDMNADGVQLTDWRQGVLFDVDGSGQQRRSGWVDSEDGLLVRDNNQDGIINDIGETFSPYTPGKAYLRKRWQDGWAALAQHDGNQDGVIDSHDALWKELKIWIDNNHDGRSFVDANNNGRLDAGEQTELHSLDELGISQLQLPGREAASGTERSGNRLLRQGSFIRHGETQEAWSVDFTADAVRHTVNMQAGGTLLRASLADLLSPAMVDTTTTWVSHSEVGETLDAGERDVSHLIGGNGDDTLIARATGSWLVGNGGRNRYLGGEGDDVLVISATDRQEDIDGGGGSNMAIFAGDEAMTLNMAAARIHIAEAGRGDATLISGGRIGVYMRGGQGNNLLIGGAGDDVMVGGQGNNVIIGGSGKAVIHGGPKDDIIYAARQGSIIYPGGGHDEVMGGEGDDAIIAGTGTATIDGGEGVNVVELQGSYAEYRIEKLPEGEGTFRITDTLTGRNGELVIKNIQRLTFDDIAAVPLQGQNAMPVTDALRVDNAGQLLHRKGEQRIAAAQLLANDHRLSSQGELRIASVSEAIGGAVSLTETGDVLFMPDARYPGIMGFKYRVVDAAGNPAIAVQELAQGAMAAMQARVALLTADIPDEDRVGQQHYLSDARVFPVWQDGYSGQGVRIGQFEPGGAFATGAEVLDYTHKDLAPNIDKRWLAAQRKAGTLTTQFSEHATQVAGVMVAAQNHQGITGIAHRATLAGHYLANNGNDVSELSHLSSYDIANHSWGLKANFLLNQSTRNAVSTAGAIVANIRYAAERGRAGLGIINVTSGGNTRAQGGSAQGSYTNNHRFGIQVGAVNAAGDLSTLRVPSVPFSNPGTSLLIAASGSQILSTGQQVQNVQGGLQGNTYSLTAGTSFAAPVTSGVVALMLEANPDLGYRDVQAILAASAYQIHNSHTAWRDNQGTRWNGGGMHASDDYGFGHIDARAAVRLAETWFLQQTADNLSFYEASSPVFSKVAQPVITHGLPLQSGMILEHIEVDLDLDCEHFGDAMVRLISPQGTQSLLLHRPGKIPAGMEGAQDADLGDRRSGKLRHTFLSNHHRGEASGGEWKLEVRDATSGTPLTLNRWHLRAYGSKKTADDTWLYTDEYAALSARDSRRQMLNDAVNGTAGGRNTLNAAAVSGDVSLNLQSGRADLGGSALTIVNPEQLHNLFSGDGNDHLTAGRGNSVLDAGRGSNHLTGGQGKDIFVVRKRESGSDTLHNFNVAQGDRLHLVGARETQSPDFTLQQQGADTEITWGTQQIVLKSVPMQPVNAQHILRQQHLKVPESYFNSASIATQLPKDQGEVSLTGGRAFVNLEMQDGKMHWFLSGTIYQRNPQFSSNHFVVQVQAPEIKRYGNAIQGFRPGIDKLDLTASGIRDFSELSMEQSHWGVANGIATIRGTQLLAQLSGVKGKPVELAWLDTIMPEQLSERDFIFTGRQPRQVKGITSPLLTPHSLVAQGQSTNKAGSHSVNDALRSPPIDSLADSLVAFTPPADGQMRFSSEWQAALVPMMAAGCQ